MIDITQLQTPKFSLTVFDLHTPNDLDIDSLLITCWSNYAGFSKYFILLVFSCSKANLKNSCGL